MIETLQDIIVMPSEIFSLIIVLMILFGILIGFFGIIFVEIIRKATKERRKYMRSLNDKQLRDYIAFREKII